MANTLTGLVPVIYEAFDIVAREQQGFVNSVAMDANAEMAAVGQTVRSYIAPPATAADITPGATVPNTGSQTFNYIDTVISKARAVPVQWTGEEQKSVNGQYSNMLRDQFTQAFRTLSNEMETDIAAAALLGASRAYGTAGTTPFGTAGDLSDFAGVQRILDENGAPIGDRFLVSGHAAMANLRGKQSVLFKVNEAGSDQFLRQGILGQVEGLNLKTSRFVATQTAGTGASYVIDGTGNTAVGSTVLKLKTGTGTILAGDVITIGNFKYVVTSALSGGLVTIAAPGLMATVADGNTVTVNSSYVGNIALHKQAIQLLARQPAMPLGGDCAADVMPFTDPVSGLTFQIALYKTYKQIHIEVGLAWGVKVVKPEFISTLLG